MPLTISQIRNAKPKPKAMRSRLSDGHGLWLEVSRAGGRHWRYRYKLGGKEHLYAAGKWCVAPYGETDMQATARRAAGMLTLSEARAEREMWRAMVVRGSHPIDAKRAEKLTAAASNANTFAAVSAEFVRTRGQEWSESHRFRVESFMQRDVFPEIGALPVRDVTSAMVLAILRKVEARNALNMAALGRGFIGQVFRYAVATGRADNDPTLALRGALQTRDVKHHAPLEKADIPNFFEALATKARVNRQTEIAVRLLAYLFTRPAELRGAAWSEFDLSAAEWRIPADRMKMSRPHVVPLSAQAVVLLRELHELTGPLRWLFPHSRHPRTCMGHSTFNHVIDRMGYAGRFSAHGFRATASTMLHEIGFPSELIERQLAHAERNKSKAAYDHSARLPERRQMMQSWADMLDEMMKPKSNVLPIGRRSA